MTAPHGDQIAEARQPFGVPDAQVGPLEIVILLVISVGAIVLPVLPVGLLLGCLLLWRSRCWSERAKWIGGYLPLLVCVAVLAIWLPLHTVVGPSLALLAVIGLTGLVLPLASAGYLAIRLGRRLRLITWAVLFLVFTAVATPAALGVAQPTTSAYIGGPSGGVGTTKCGGFYAAKHFSQRGTINVSVGVCWDGSHVWKDWGPNCAANFDRLATLTVRSCTSKTSGLALEIELRYSYAASTSPLIGGSATEAWLVLPNGSIH